MLASLKILPKILAAFSLGFFAFHAAATTYYVNQNNPNPASPYLSWATAATNIEDAAGDALFGSSTILVTNGIYQYGGYVDSSSASNRVYLANNVILQSVNGPAVTVIEGYQVPGTTNGSTAVRCAYLNSGAILSGFTLTSGATPIIGFGGGVYCASVNCLITNCIITGNSAYSAGGGAYSGTLVNCIFSNNDVQTYGSGGGAYDSAVSNCLLTANSAGENGGAAYGGTLVNCSLVANFAGDSGGGAYDSMLTNCLLAANSSAGEAGPETGAAAGSSTLVNCTVVSNMIVVVSYSATALEGCILKNSIAYYNSNFYGEADVDASDRAMNCCMSITNVMGANNFTNPPIFLNPAAANYRLQVDSPCINAGNNSFVVLSNDLDGNPRIVGGTVDLGAYENQNTSMVHYVVFSNTVPVSPFTNWMTAATNIQDAIDAANSGDFILVSNGVYQIGGRAIYGTATNRVTLDQPVTVQSVNGPSVTTIRGYNLGSGWIRCAYLTNGAFLSGFTLTNGVALGMGDMYQAESGGGVWCSGSSATVSNCVLVGNSAPTYGGAAFQGTLVNCILTNNSGGFGGAACSNLLLNCTLIKNIANAQNLNTGGGAFSCTLSNCLLVGNVCIGGLGGGGAYGSVLMDCVLSNNSSTYGGGAAASFIMDSIISSNRAGSAGGGSFSNTLNGCILIYNSAIYGGGACLGLVMNSILSNNVAGSGGGACSNTLVNCLLVDNQANYDGRSFGACGGAAFLSSLINCTVVSNSVVSAPGGAAGGGVYGGTLSNCIVYFNSTSEAGLNFYFSGMSYCDTTPSPTNGFGNITNAPLFVNPSVGNYHLQSTSPCINAGNNAYVTTTTDLDGNPRIIGGTVDIGAYEYQTPTSAISYAWLQQYGLPTDGSVDYADLDGTAFNVYQNWAAGLNPTNPASVLAMNTPAATNNPSGITVTWQSVTNILYSLQRATNLPAFTTVQSNIPGQAGVTSYTDISATNNVPYFYRVGVIAP